MITSFTENKIKQANLNPIIMQLFTAIYIYSTVHTVYNITFTPQINGILEATHIKCTPVYIKMYMYPGKVIALQKNKPFSSKQGTP